MYTHLRVVSATATALVLAACAATPLNVKPNTTSAAIARNPACLSQTGSRITGDRASCMAFGHSYSGDDIDRTGYLDVGDALRVLDPTVTVHH